MMMNCSTAFPISVTSWSSTDDSYIISDPHKRLTLLDTFCRTRQRKPCDPCLVPSPYFMKAICRTKALFGHVGTDCGLWVSMAAALALAINPPPKTCVPAFYGIKASAQRSFRCLPSDRIHGLAAACARLQRKRSQVLFPYGVSLLFKRGGGGGGEFDQSLLLRACNVL